MIAIKIKQHDNDVESTLIRMLESSPLVESWWHELGYDSGGNSAVWIWLVVPDSVAKSLADDLTQLANCLETDIRLQGKLWPYVYFCSVSEHSSSELCSLVRH